MKSTLAALLLTGLAPLGAAVLPYTNDFSGTGSNTALTELNDAHWALNNGAYRYTFTSTTVSPSVASVQITDVAGVDFTMETQFTVVSTGTLNGSGQRVGFGLLGASTGFGGSNASSAYYLADFLYANAPGGEAAGTLRILAQGSSLDSTTQGSADANTGAATLAVALDTTYTLRLTGSYSGSVLTMTLGLFDATGSASIGSSAVASDATPLTGANFGFRNRTGLGGGTAIVDFDNFSVAPTAIPEPSAALGVGGLALFGALAARRKDRRRC